MSDLPLLKRWRLEVLEALGLPPTSCLEDALGRIRAFTAPSVDINGIPVEVVLDRPFMTLIVESVRNLNVMLNTFEASHDACAVRIFPYRVDKLRESIDEALDGHKYKTVVVYAVSTHIAPREVSEFVDTLKRVHVERGVNVVLATSNTLVMNALNGDADKSSVFVLRPYYPNGAALPVIPAPVNEVVDADWLDSFTLGELYAQGKLGGPAIRAWDAKTALEERPLEKKP